MCRRAENESDEMMPIEPSLIHDTIRVLESCEAKLEYLGQTFTGPRRYSEAPDCLHRADKARDMIATLRRLIDRGANGRD